MKTRSDPTHQLLGHLTGSLAEESRTELERRVLEDDALYEQLKSAEGEIVDAYIHGELAEAEEGRIAALLESSDRLKAQAELSVALDTANPKDTAHPRDRAHLTGADRSGGKSERVDGIGARTEGRPASRWLEVVGLILLLVALAWLGLRSVMLEGSLREEQVERLLLEHQSEVLNREVEALEEEIRRTSRRLSRLEAERRLEQ